MFHISSNFMWEMSIQSPTIWLENKSIQIILEDRLELYIKSIEIKDILWISCFSSKNLNDHEFKYKDIHLSIDYNVKLKKKCWTFDKRVLDKVDKA